MEKIIITGDREAGKSTLCIQLSDRFLSEGWHVSGILSPGIYQDARKTGIGVIDIQTRQEKQLAVRMPEGQKNAQGLNWDFDPKVMEWANSILKHSIPTDILIIDELGPLEFFHNTGWYNAFSVVESGEYKICILVIRPELLSAAQKKWFGSEILVLKKNKPISFLMNNLYNKILHPYNIDIFPTTASDIQLVDQLIQSYWGSIYIIIDGEKIRPSQYSGYLAFHNQTFIGAITYRMSKEEIEILTLNSMECGKGIARKLLTQVIKKGKENNIYTYKLMTTNDNLSALKFYQRFGFGIRNIKPKEIEKARSLKPQIPILGEYDIPITDEIYLELTI